MILSGPEIVRLVRATRELRAGGHPAGTPALDIEPFAGELAGPNSYDVALADTLLTYRRRLGAPLSTRGPNEVERHHVPESGFILRPGKLYLGSTVERTACAGLVPWLDGRSSVGRLGISIHATAGRGDDGFGWPDGSTWTLEITVAEPVVLYPGLRIGQLTFFRLEGERKPYSGRYQSQSGPTGSRLHEGDRG